MDISYAAHTASCTFLLDEKGICRRIVMTPKAKAERAQAAAKCVGAQYVASLDATSPGGLIDMPRVGAAMLFARVDTRGRVSLARTGTLLRFESRKGQDPFVASQSVETSAPLLDDFNLGEPPPRAFAPDDFGSEAEDDDFDTTHELVTAEYQAVAGSSKPSAPWAPESTRPPPARGAGVPTARRRGG